MFTLEELASYLQVDAVNASTGALLHDLTEGLILDLVGVAASANPRVKPIALEVAARAYRNANGYASETVDDYTYRRAATTQEAGVYLTDTERATLLAVRGGFASRSVRSVKLRSASGPWTPGVIEER
jgi:5'-deoxynucleotidase YfbR-like HD superfamily hydrolase